MNPSESAFYPPRAGWLARRLGGWYRLRRDLVIERFAPPLGVPSWTRFALWMLVPGAMCLARGQRLRGFAMLGSWVLGLAVFWVSIGLSGATWAYMYMSGIHSLTAM